MRRFKLDAAEPEYDTSDPEGYRAGMDRFGPKIGATRLGGSVYELPPGQSICPYHYEYPEEEWLFVLTGRVEVRTPEGEEELGPMAVVCFPSGPEGAHKVTNRGDETAQVVMLSTKPQVSVAVYPDSGKMLASTGNPDDRLMARRESAVDYYDGET
ncbi:MAG: cupin domain-containing protein [Solirubrobacteraceae bacterium]